MQRNRRVPGSKPWASRRQGSVAPFVQHIRVAFCVRASGGQSFNPRRCQSEERPNCHCANQGGSIVQQGFRFGRKRGIAGITYGNEHIADETVTAGAFDRRTPKESAEIRIVKPRKFSKRGVFEFFPRVKFVFACCLRKFVPRTDGEAI